MLSKLRHPVRATRESFGTAGLVVAVVALIAALAGTAIAAGGLTAVQKKQVIKIAKKYAGQDGAPGATGPAGPAGTNGTNGEKGAAGEKGATGNTGAQGPIGNTGAQGPIGNTGAQGPIGSPWTAGGTLPSGKTETGTFAVSGAELTTVETPISFPIPLVAALGGSNVKRIQPEVRGEGNLVAGSTTVNNLTKTTPSPSKFEVGYSISGGGIPAGATITACSPGCGSGATSLTISAAPTATELEASLAAAEPTPTGCTGGTVAEPKANPGFLCIYSGLGSQGVLASNNKPTGLGTGASVTGSRLRVTLGNFETVPVAFGSFAVTAP